MVSLDNFVYFEYAKYGLEILRRNVAKGLSLCHMRKGSYPLARLRSQRASLIVTSVSVQATSENAAPTAPT